MTNESDCQEDEIRLIRFEVFRDSDTIGVCEYIEALDEKEGSCKVHGQGDGDRAGQKAPAADPGGGTTTPCRGQGKSLVVDTASGGIYGGDLSERCGDTQHDQRYDYPAPDHDGWGSPRHGVHHGSGETVGHRGQDEDHEHDLPC